MNKLKHHFLWGLVFLGTITFWYIWYSAYTSLSTQNDWAIITKDIWNNVITTINDIWNRTDWIYSSWWNIGIWNSNPTSKLDVNWLFKVNTNDNTITTSKDIKEFSWKITGPGNWPACTDGNKIVTLWTITSDSPRSFIDVELYWTHRWYDNWGYFEYKKWVIMVWDKVSSNLISTSWTNSASLSYNNNTAAWQNIQITIAPRCWSAFYYTYVVRYRSDMTFIPSSQRDW